MVAVHMQLAQSRAGHDGCVHVALVQAMQHVEPETHSAGLTGAMHAIRHLCNGILDQLDLQSYTALAWFLAHARNCDAQPPARHHQDCVQRRAHLLLSMAVMVPKTALKPMLPSWLLIQAPPMSCMPCLVIKI